MTNTINYTKRTRNIYKMLDKEDKKFYFQVDTYLREYDLLRTEFIEAKWIIISDMYSKLGNVENAWAVYEDPKQYCESIVSRYNREYIGVKGRLLYRILPMATLLIVFMILLFSPNGFSSLLNANNEGIQITASFLIIILLQMASYISLMFDQSKKIFQRKSKINILFWVFLAMYTVTYWLNIQYKEFDRNYIILNPIVLFVILIMLLSYFLINRKKLFY